MLIYSKLHSKSCDYLYKIRLKLIRLLARRQDVLTDGLPVSKFKPRRNVDGFFYEVSTREGLVSIFSQLGSSTPKHPSCNKRKISRRIKAQHSSSDLYLDEYYYPSDG